MWICNLTQQLLQYSRTIALNAPTELSPMCAIVGGILAQDILNTLSQKELPISNFFVYDGFEGKYIKISFFFFFFLKKSKLINSMYVFRFWINISSTTRKKCFLK